MSTTAGIMVMLVTAGIVVGIWYCFEWLFDFQVELTDAVFDGGGFDIRKTLAFILWAIISVIKLICFIVAIAFVIQGAKDLRDWWNKD